MQNDFSVSIDRLIANPRFEEGSGIDREEAVKGVSVNTSVVINVRSGSKEKELSECRICQEEDEDNQMEAPCACSGTLKFAHRKCIQRWCNKKGDIICEICHQVFAPNYSIPPTQPSSDGLAIDFRPSWGHRIDLQGPRFLALASAEHQLLQAEYVDYPGDRLDGIDCCRGVALILMLFLFLQHILMVMMDAGLVQNAATLLDMHLILFGCFLVPSYAMVRALYILHKRRRRQG